MTDLAPFWIREMQDRIEADWNKMHADQHRARMRKITDTLPPNALRELWGNMELEEPDTVEIVTLGEPGVVTVDTVTGKFSGLLVHTSLPKDDGTPSTTPSWTW